MARANVRLIVIDSVAALLRGVDTSSKGTILPALGALLCEG